MTDAYLPTERHLHAVPALPNPLPWWCRTFGHTYIRADRRDTWMCRRCGTRP